MRSAGSGPRASCDAIDPCFGQLQTSHALDDLGFVFWGTDHPRRPENESANGDAGMRAPRRSLVSVPARGLHRDFEVATTDDTDERPLWCRDQRRRELASLQAFEQVGRGDVWAHR